MFFQELVERRGARVTGAIEGSRRERLGRCSQAHRACSLANAMPFVSLSVDAASKHNVIMQLRS